MISSMRSEKRFLISTSLKQTWVDDQPILFLGKWCCLYSDRDNWGSADYKVLPYHWDDRDKLSVDFEYLTQLYESLLRRLVKQLNQLHKVAYSVRYWRIRVGPWLMYFLHMLFDRWESVRLASIVYEISGTVKLLYDGQDDRQFVPNDMSDFANFFQDDAWNQYIYTEIIGATTSIPLIVKTIHTTEKKSINQPPLTNDLLSCAKSVCSRVLQYFIKAEDFFFVDTYLPTVKAMALQLSFGQTPQLIKSIQPSVAELDKHQRCWSLLETEETENAFERFAMSLIPKQLPKIYLEGYAQLNRQVAELRWPKSPRLIFTANALWHDDAVMAYAAEKIERGSLLLYGQHGGGYGTAKFHAAEEHEIRIANRYLTMGWGRQSNPKIRPIGVFNFAKQVSGPFHVKRRLLLITMNPPRFSFRLCSESARNVEEYQENLFELVQAMSSSIQHAILVRLSRTETGRDQPKQWLDRIPKISVDLGYVPINQLMSESRLIISTYNQTTILETLAYGIPSILFCHLAQTPIRDSAIPFYKELKRVGILHDTPQSAASHINKVWDNIDLWWSSDDVQNVVCAFVQNYCRRNRKINTEIRIVIKDMLQDRNATAI